MSKKTLKKVIISAGGTGGHIFPALALAEVLKKEGVEVEWIGTADRMEATLVPKYGYPIHFIEISGVVSKGILAYIKAPFKVIKATYAALKILKNSKADAVITMGGYVVGPVGLAARLKRLPLIIHEQNSVMGLTNKILKKIATKTLSAFPITGVKAEDVVGQPLRSSFFTKSTEEKLALPKERAEKELAALKVFIKDLISNNKIKVPIDLNIDEVGLNYYSNLRSLLTKEEDYKFASSFSRQEPLRILSVGGSLGAQHLNEVLVPAIQAYEKEGFAAQVIQQCGKNKAAEVAKAAKKAKLRNFQAVEFIDDIDEAYHNADLIICRSGAITVFEIAASQRLAAFVPYPGHKDQQQSKNAHYLSDKDLAYTIEQKDCTPEAILNLLLSLNYPQIYQKTQNLTAISQSNAAQKVVNITRFIVEKK